MAAVKEEKKSKETANLITYHFHNPESKVNRISREVFKTIDKEIHYPFVARTGGDKYKHVKRFVYNGFKGKFPIGVYKSVFKGYGFTRELNALGKYLNETLQVQEVIINKAGNPSYDAIKHTITFSEGNMGQLYRTLDAVLTKNSADLKQTVDSILHQLLPKDFSKPARSYTKNALASTISAWGNSIDEFSPADKTAIKDLFEKLSLTDFLTDTSLSKTKEIIDNKYLQQTLNKYKKLMTATGENETVEKKWQAFLKEHNWIFSRIFAQPVILYKDEAYVGGKTMDNVNGKFNDFLIQSPLSSNVSFLEIKTHKTPLMEKSVYRGNDVYSSSKDLTGAIVQVLNQRSNFQKEYWDLLGKTRKAAATKPAKTTVAKKTSTKTSTVVTNDVHFETHNSKCVVLVGSISDLEGTQKDSFELFRNNSRDVEIITFDELQKKIEALQDLLNT